MHLDRETLAAAVVAAGGAWLLGSALFRRRARWTSAQLRGLAMSGLGFLLIASSARWLQHLGARGVAVSFAGVMLALRGMIVLLQERAQRGAEHAERSDQPK